MWTVAGNPTTEQTLPLVVMTAVPAQANQQPNLTFTLQIT